MSFQLFICRATNDSLYFIIENIEKVKKCSNQYKKLSVKSLNYDKIKYKTQRRLFYNDLKKK